MNNLFLNITPRNIAKILQSLEANSNFYKKNSSILKDVKKDNFICIVIDGYLQIIKNDYNGNKIVIEKLEKNSIFGTLISPLSNEEYEVVTKEDSKLVIIDFNSIIINNEINSNVYNQFLKNILNIMAIKIKEYNERIEILANKTIRNKLLAYFKIASKKSKSKIIYLPFNFSELADYLVVDRCAMSRELKNLKDDGLIEVEGKKIKLFYTV